MKNKKKKILVVSILLAGMFTMSSCEKEVSIDQTIEAGTSTNDIGMRGGQTSPFLGIRCGVQTSPIPPLPNIYASVGGDFSGIRVSSITRLQVTCRYVSSASGGTENIFVSENTGFTVTSKTSGSYRAAFSLPNYQNGDLVEGSSVIYGKDGVVLARSVLCVCNPIRY